MKSHLGTSVHLSSVRKCSISSRLHNVKCEVCSYCSLQHLLQSFTLPASIEAMALQITSLMWLRTIMLLGCQVPDPMDMRGVFWRQ